ncbi:hypothetical protein LZ012_18050 [Dechloromonas sp. XY25]|uniref:Lipoprotein n=1 Tax=Dechloromonas hankyongensis TaxID=2908002 RepID=A0ABS9K747_9RHOO|nr:hypothetical protein [Dechloromonas hankyongensis]MCG2578900.1 hypothetical protein [Dechloromonas hankyongensis]
MYKLIPALIAALALTACDQIEQKLGLEDPAKKEARMEPEAKAVGSACRQSGRAIEDCYAIYGWLPKAGIYAGWREMDEYMRENKLETVAPQLPPPEPPGTKKKARKTTEDAPVGEAKAETKAEVKSEAKAEARADSEKKADKH